MLSISEINNFYLNIKIHSVIIQTKYFFLFILLANNSLISCIILFMLWVK